MPFLALKDQSTTVLAWFQAVQALDKCSKQAYNFIYSVTDPGTLTDNDKNVIKVFNKYALANELHSTDTVANTIFPLDTYLSKGGDDFYEFYLAEVFPRVRKQWGTYFYRMICRKNDDGSTMTKDGTALNPLVLLIEKVARRISGTGKTKTHYELALDDPALELSTYDAHHDSKYQIGGPCLSHLSFKIEGEGVLALTAFYRSHWYIGRALGNLVGLARLQRFVADQSGAKVGSLTIVASEAILDLSATGRSAATTRAMLAECAAIYGAS